MKPQSLGHTNLGLHSKVDKGINLLVFKYWSDFGTAKSIKDIGTFSQYNPLHNRYAKTGVAPEVSLAPLMFGR